MAGQRMAPPRAMLRFRVAVRCCCSRARRWSGVRMVGGGVAILGVGAVCVFFDAFRGRSGDLNGGVECGGLLYGVVD